MNSKYSQKIIDRAKQCATEMCLKLLQKEQFKETVGAPCDLNSNRMYDKITKVWENSHNNNSETIRNEDDKEICNECIYF